MNSKPLITLTTDFGTRDGYAGAMKGRILSLSPDCRILDISHEIPPQDRISARFTLHRALRQFTKPTIHIGVIDPGVGSSRKALAVETEAGFLVGPDNGIFSGVLEEFPPKRVVKIHERGPHWQRHSSFDGLHCFSPVGACLANGWDLEQVGERVEHWEKLELEEPRLIAGGWEGIILLFDRFGNAVTNLPGSHADPGDTLLLDSHSLPLVPHYQAAAQFESAAFLVNSDGLIEITVWQDSARERLGIYRGARVRLERSAVRQ